MKKAVVVLLCMVLASFGFSQKEMKKSELSTDYFLVDVKASENMFSTKYKGTCIAYNKKTKEFLLYGAGEGTTIIYMEKIPNVALKFYPEKFMECKYEGGKVYLSSQMTNKATVYTGIFNWKEEHLTFEKEESYDISELRVKRANDLLKGGKVQESLATYDSVEYAESYFDLQKTGIELLLGSQKTISELSSKRKFKDAADLSDKIFAFKGMKWMFDIKNETDLKTAIGKNLHGLTYNDLQMYYETYLQNLLEAKLYDKVIEKANANWKYFMNSANLLLYTADAWYGKKDKTKASEYYIKYTEQMKKLKKEKDIPYYVPQRIQ